MAKKIEYPPEFEEAWDLYPRRPNNNKRKAAKAWNARIKEGYTPEELIAGLKAYLAWAEDTGTILKHTSTFFGPNLHFLDFLNADLDSTEENEDEGDEDSSDLLHFYEEEELV